MYKCLSIFSCDQAALWMVQFIRLSVRPSVCHTFFTMFPSSYHHEIFSSDYQWQKWCKRSRSKVKVTEVKTHLFCFRTITQDWIHIWWWNVAQSLMLLRRGALLFFNVICQISRSHAYQWLRNDAQSLKWHKRGALWFFKAICQISRSHGAKNYRFSPKLGISGL